MVTAELRPDVINRTGPPALQEPAPGCAKAATVPEPDLSRPPPNTPSPPPPPSLADGLAPPKARGPTLACPARTGSRLGPTSSASQQLSTACRAAGLPEDDLASVERLLAELRLSPALLLSIVRSSHYTGRELALALQASAIILHAAGHRLLAAEAAAGLCAHLLPAIEAGRLRFASRPDMRESSAQYHPLHNQICLTEPIPDLCLAENRALLLHECEHARQDACAETDNRYGFEARGHRAFADYLLRTSGCLRDPGPRVDLDRYNALLARGMAEGRVWSSGPDLWALQTVMARALEAAGFEPGLVAAIAPTEPFTAVYLRAQQQSPSNAAKTAAQLHAELARGYVKDGLARSAGAAPPSPVGG